MSPSPLFQRQPQAATAPASKPTPAPVQPAPQHTQTSPAVPVNIFKGIAAAKVSQMNKLPNLTAGHYFARVDTMRLGQTDIEKGAVYNYVVIEGTIMCSFEDHEGASLAPGTQFKVFYSDKMYRQSFLGDLKGFLMACFGLSQEQADAVKEDGTPVYSEEDWSMTIAEACQPEQTLKGYVVELRGFLNRKGSYCKSKWVRRVPYTELDKIMPRDEVRARILPDLELQKQIGKEASVA